MQQSETKFNNAKSPPQSVCRLLILVLNCNGFTVEFSELERSQNGGLGLTQLQKLAHRMKVAPHLYTLS